MNKDTQLIWEASKLDGDLIKQLYIDQGQSAEKIGEQLGVHGTTILKRLKRMGVKIRSATEPLPLDNDLIKQLYLDQGLSTDKIGKQLGVTHKTILRRLEQMDVDRRSNDVELDNDLIKQLYLDQGLSAEKIGKQLGVGFHPIIKRLKRMGVAIRKPGSYEGPNARRDDLDNDLIKQLYLDQGLSTDKIGKQFGVASNSISKRLEQMGVERRGSARDDLDNDLIKQLFDQGQSPNQIAKQLGVANKTISRRLIKMGVENIDRRVSGDLDNDLIKQLYDQGHNPNQIGKQLGVTHKTIRRRLEQMGVKLSTRPRGPNKRYKEGKRVIRKITSPVRSSDLIRDSKEANELQNDGFLTCNKCGLQPSKDYYHRGEKVTRDQSWKIIEGHHIDGVQEKDATPDDIEMLCKNCHIYETRIKI